VALKAFRDGLAVAVILDDPLSHAYTNSSTKPPIMESGMQEI
jgi:hypothetical protein